MRDKTILKAAGITAIVFGGLGLLFWGFISYIIFLIGEETIQFGIYSIIGFAQSIILVVGGIYILRLNKLEDSELLTKKNSVLAWSIAFVLINWIVGLCSFLAYSKITKIEPTVIKNEPITKEIKEKKLKDKKISNLNILLNLGVGMIVLAIMILSFSNWDIINELTKVGILLTIGIVFIAFSLFIEKIIKIKSTVITHWILGMLFIFFSYIAAVNFEIFGPTLKFFSTYNLAEILMFSFSALLLLITYFKFKAKGIIIPIYISFTCLSFLLFEGILNSIFAHIINFAIFTFGTFIKLGKNVWLDLFRKFSKVLFIITSSIVILMALTASLDLIELILTFTSLITIIIVSYAKFFFNKENESQLKVAILTTLAITASVAIFQIDAVLETLLITSILVSLYLINLFTKQNKLILTSSIVINIILCTLLILTAHLNPLVTLFNAMALILLPILNELMGSKLKYENIILPVKLFIFILAILNVFDVLEHITFVDILMIASIIFLTITFISKNVRPKQVFFIGSFITLVASRLFYSMDITSFNNLLFESLQFCLIIILYIYNTNSKILKLNGMKDGLFIGILILNYSLFNYIAVTYPIPFVPSIVTILSYLTINMLISKNKIYQNIIIGILILPIYDILQKLDIPSSIVVISLVSYIVFMIYNFVINFMNKISKRNIFLSITIPILYMLIIFRLDVIIGLYVGVTSFIMIMLGLYKKEYNSLFILGIILTIVNLAVQLYNLWDSIPWWIYLLIIGLAIVVIATVKIIKVETSKEQVETFIDKKAEIFKINSYDFIKVLLYIFIIIFISSVIL